MAQISCPHLILKKGLPHICAHVPRVTLNVKQTKGSSVSCIKAFILPINFSIRFLPFLPLVFYSHPLKWKVDEHEKSPNALSITRWHSPVHFHAPISALKGTLDVEIQKKNEKNFFALLRLTEHLQLKVKSSLERQKSWGK